MLAATIDGSRVAVAWVPRRSEHVNDATLAFDEAMVIMNGKLTVATHLDTVTAQSGEIVYMPRGAHVSYRSHEVGAVIAYVTYPHWQEQI